jgi:sulfur-oxidizing protein SoxY
MSCNRREFIKKSIVLTACSAAASSVFLSPPSVYAEPAAGSLKQTLDDLFKGATISESNKIGIRIPKIAENGAVVPITVTSTLSDVRNVFILVEKNPLPLSAKFVLSPELEPFVSARLKMAETSDVMVVVETKEALYSARETVKVTIGGCGG